MRKMIMLLVICFVAVVPLYAWAECGKDHSDITEFSPLHTAAQNLRKVHILIGKGEDERAKLYFAQAMDYYSQAECVLKKTIGQGDIDVNLDVEQDHLIDKIRARHKAAEDEFRAYCWDNKAGTIKDKPHCYPRDFKKDWSKSRMRRIIRS